MSETIPRPKTPPTSPKYGVNLFESTIRSIVQHCIPHIPSGPSAFTISTLRSDQSLYNRIYFITPQTGYGYVLKVSGRTPGKAKIENEVSSLLLLQHYCPDVPVPRPIAWYRGPRTGVERYLEDSGDGSSGTITHEELDVDEMEGVIRPWLLMTRLPGRELDVATLTPSQISSVADQLADMVAAWRQNIPKSILAGNMNFHPSPVSENSCATTAAVNIPSQAFDVHGLLGSGTGYEPPMASLLEYWRTSLECEISKLYSKAKLAGSLNSEIIPALVQEFIVRTSPHLSICRPTSTSANGADGFVFTHTDFARRNVLVSETEDNSVIVTGIIDFEFAGFFPAAQEFYAEMLNLPRPDGIGLGAEGDWPRGMYWEFLRKLEGIGVITPLLACERDTREWRELCALRRLEVFIAPPILAEDEVEVAKLLELCRGEVEKAVAELKEIVADGLDT